MTDTTELLKQADILAGMLRMGEHIEFGRDADMIERLSAALKAAVDDLQEALRRYDERNRTAQDRAVSNGLKLERIAKLESELAGCKIALEQAWESNRERQAEIERLVCNAQTEAWLLAGYHRICERHGIAPSSAELIAAAKEVEDEQVS